MIKLVALLKRKPGMTREDFRRRWLIEHTKLSSKLPGCLEYRINVATEHQPEGDETDPVYDGTAELWWESMEAMESSFRTRTGKIAGDDADLFCEVRIHIYTEEYVVVRNGEPVQPPEKVS
jgi:uncharacterized protein (TIGR02118 family)